MANIHRMFTGCSLADRCLVRVLLITVDDSPYLPESIEALILNRRDLIGVVVLTSGSYFGTTSLLGMVVTGLKRYGFRGFMGQSFRYLRFRIPRRLRALLKYRGGYSVSAVARRYSIPVYPSKDVNDADLLGIIADEVKPDVIVSFGSGQLFKKDILRIPDRGCINVHPSLLPSYRGPSPLFWVLANGEAETGVTVHYMDEKLDSGDIILQSKIKIEEGDTVQTLRARTKEQSVALLIQALDQIASGTVSTILNDSRYASYYTQPNAEDIKAFIRRGGRFY